MQTTKFKEFAGKYLGSVETSLGNLALEEIGRIAEILFRAYRTGKRVIAFGNGGSAVAASHFVSDLAKGCAMRGKKRFRALSLCDNIPMLTAYANDCGYEHIFSEQLKNWVEKGDVVIGISASGNSRNVLNAIKTARKKSAVTIGLTGFKGGRLKGLVSECVVVRNDNMERIEDIHLIILHILKLFLISRIRKV